MKYRYTLQKIASIVKGKLLTQQKNCEEVINFLYTDSRNCKEIEHSLFFALKTKRNDGHKYIGDLAKLGYKNFVVERIPFEIQHNTSLNFIIVPNPLTALQILAADHRSKFSYPVLAITGSTGKTTVKEWLFVLMGEDFKIAKNPKSFNSQIGVPLSIWEMDSSSHLGIFEAGISEVNEMEKLEKVIQPTIGLFTNIGTAHDKFFHNQIQKASEKLKLFPNVQVLIYCVDQKEVDDCVKHWQGLRHVKLFTWSKQGQKADLEISEINKFSKKTDVKACLHGTPIEISIPFTDEASIENAIHCWVFMLSQGYENSVINQRMSLLHPLEMRLELKEGINDCTLINDAYNSDYSSFLIALDYLCQQPFSKSKTVILSDFLQSGFAEDELYANIATALQKKGINHLIGIGEAINRQAGKFILDKQIYKTTEEFIDKIDTDFFQNQIILIKGARSFSFERIASLLQAKSHETVLEINMNSILHNFNFFKSKLKPETKIMVMGKALSYGNGSYEIANLLEYHNCNYITVAYSDEGVQLRKNGIKLPIMVMNPEEKSMEQILKYDLEPEVYNFHILSLLIKELENNHIQRKIKIHIELDSGMRRLGFEAHDLPKLIELIKRNPILKIESVFTHLATADDPKMDKYTLGQLHLFEKLSNLITSHFDYKIDRHALNTAGISRFPNYQFDMVRLGIGLYGLGLESEQANLQNVSTLKTVISQIKTIQAGDAIGYGRNYIAPKEIKMGVIPIGYADGLDRKLGNGNFSVSVKGIQAPILGTICMDMCMINLTDIPCSEGDEVIIFSDAFTINSIAEKLDTISYEIITKISSRVKRIYFQE